MIVILICSNNVVASRSLDIKHPFRTHSWKYKSEPIIDTPINREKLWRKYEALVHVLKKNNYQELAKIMAPGIQETENYQGDPIEHSWEKSILGQITGLWDAGDYDVYLGDRDDVELIISPDGELFRFEIKEAANAMLSPIMISAFGEEITINETFTMIDGEIVVAY